MRLRVSGVPILRNQVLSTSVRYNLAMPPEKPARRRQRTPPPGETGQEALYLRSLSERQVPVHVKLRDGEMVSGWIEYFDDRMIRLTREGKPNLFIYKQQIRTITEHGRDGRRRPRREEAAEDAL
jgi:host factor-I protein